MHDLEQFDRLIGKPPREVTREEVDQFVENQLERGLAAKTINRRLAAVHAFFEYLAAESQAEEWTNPVSWKRHKVKAGKPLPRDLSEAEIARLFEQIQHPRDQALFGLMLEVGLRVEETAELSISDLTVNQADGLGRLRVRGKGDKERFVWLMPETLELVQAWIAVRPQVTTQALFITRRKEGFTPRGIQERLKHYGDLAGIKVSPHRLRHTFGRRMAEAGMPVTSLAALMGHAQVTTTQLYTAGAGVALQADYEAAMARLTAERLPHTPMAEQTPASSVVGTEMLDVWSLAGEEPSAAVSQPLPPAKMDLSRYWEGLPHWLVERLQGYIVYKQRRWKPSQLHNHTRSRLNTLRRVWCRLLDQDSIDSLTHLQGAHLQRFVETRLADGVKPMTVNGELTDLWAFLNFWEERGIQISPAVFRVKRPQRGDPLPRFLSESDYAQLQRTVLHATQDQQRNDQLDRLWFYLLSEAGLRVGEVCDLRLGDIDLTAQRLTVRHGKKNRDRCVPLSPTLLAALTAYLPLRGPAPTDHLLIFRQHPLQHSLIQNRLRRYGQLAQVQVSPHRLRHTLATRLLNQGMPITSLQRLLGHQHLDTTLLYARVHDDTVRRDFERAHSRLTPASSLAAVLFDAPTHLVEPHFDTPGGNYV